MKNHNPNFFAVAFALLLAVNVAPAQSAQNPPPYQWTFDQVVTEKIHKTLARDGVAVGLSNFEQQTLEKYGIGIGQSFITRVDDEWRRVTRTSAGLRFEGPAQFSPAGNRQQFPIQTHYRVLPTSFTEHDRDNVSPALAWVFDERHRRKILNHVFSEEGSWEIGLSRHQQKLLHRYGIEVGDSFRASVAGRIFKVKRVGLGLQIRSLAKNKPASYLPS